MPGSEQRHIQVHTNRHHGLNRYGMLHCAQCTVHTHTDALCARCSADGMCYTCCTQCTVLTHAQRQLKRSEPNNRFPWMTYQKHEHHANENASSHSSLSSPYNGTKGIIFVKRFITFSPSFYLSCTVRFTVRCSADFSGSQAPPFKSFASAPLALAGSLSWPVPFTLFILSRYLSLFFSICF